MSVEKEDLDSDDLEEPQESESNVWFCPIILVDILSRLYLFLVVKSKIGYFCEQLQVFKINSFRTLNGFPLHLTKIS